MRGANITPMEVCLSSSHLTQNKKKINYLKNLFETVYLADIIERHNVKK